MPTLEALSADHFDGHKNLARSDKGDHGSESDLATLLGQARTDLAALEAVDTAAGTAPTLTPAAEAADVIAVAFASPVASAEQYMAEALPATTMEPTTAAFTLAETGDGAEVSTTARARLIFTTSAAGVAELSVTDVAGASAETVYLLVRPLFVSADVAQQCAPVMVAVTFD